MKRSLKMTGLGILAATGIGVGATQTSGCEPEPPTAQEMCVQDWASTDVEDQTLPYWPNNNQPHIYDARGETFAVGPGKYLKYRTSGYSANQGCWIGGEFTTSLDEQTTPWDTWHGIGTIIIDTPSVLLTSIKIHNVGDAIGFDANGRNWRIKDVHVGLAHDDCVQNDRMQNGVIENSLFENCASAFLSSRGFGFDGTENTVEVSNSLVQLIGFQNTYRCDSDPLIYCGKHGGFFKWDIDTTTSCEAKYGIAPELWVHDSVFRADERAAPFGGAPGGTMAFPRFQKDACGNTIGTNRCGPNVTLIGEGFTPTELATWQIACGTELTHLIGSEGVTEWDQRVATLQSQWGNNN